ncbi:MAG: D-alanine--D-alanine ligase [Oscillospiraceae bacterium]|nr:D-alanine--D-alanine ligase [Oscillospiraceae bacterium]
MNIVVLCGGLSNERDVSISSGTGVARALRAKGHNALLVDLYLGYTEEFNDPAEVFERGGNIADFSVAEAAPDLEAVRAMGGGCAVGPNVLRLCEYADITFLALHGEEGENGKLQATLDLHGIKYTGSGYLGSALAMNKSLTKTVLAAAGIPVPTGITVEKGAENYESVGFPCVVKPCSGGSSVGTSVVYEEKDYLPALELAFKYEKAVLVEKFIKGRELTVGVMNGKAMPVIEIIPKSGFYDYKNKYQAGATEEICPAPIGDESTAKVQRLAERVHEALMIDAYCRVDFLWNSLDGEMYCLEANTLPGMTPTSLIPQMARELGMDYGSLCEKIIEVSMEKYV